MNKGELGEVCNFVLGGGCWFDAGDDENDDAEADGGGNNFPSFISSCIALNSRNCCCFFS